MLFGSKHLCLRTSGSYPICMEGSLAHELLCISFKTFYVCVRTRGSYLGGLEDSLVCERAGARNNSNAAFL
jgi:hypothetical protein